jgi:hypothetical protein
MSALPISWLQPLPRYGFSNALIARSALHPFREGLSPAVVDEYVSLRCNKRIHRKPTAQPSTFPVLLWQDIFPLLHRRNENSFWVGGIGPR